MARLGTRLGLAACLAALLGADTAQAQPMWQQNQNFDAQFAARLGALQQQNAGGMQQVWQNYLQQFGPQLREGYRAHLAAGNMPPMSFEQFARWNMMTANGTDLGGAARAQNDWFRGQQGAHQTITGAYDRNNEAWRQRSEREMAAVDRWDRGAIQGNAPYVDPRTGATRWLPYAPQPGQIVTQGGSSYVQDRTGTYQQWQGNRWQSMDDADE
jgi:hypothetical protein